MGSVVKFKESDTFADSGRVAIIRKKSPLKYIKFLIYFFILVRNALKLSFSEFPLKLFF